MPELNGFAVAKAIQEKKLAVEIVFLTMHSEEELFRSAMDLGIRGYVLKDSAGTDILSCLRSVAAGKPYVSPSLSGLLLNRSRRSETLNSEQPGLHLLTPTEKNILKLIAEQKTSKEIGEALFVSYRTIETHRVNISRKLGLRGSLALVKFAIANRSEL
jgi:DNA-binding NarL/FixJ family response regulator